MLSAVKEGLEGNRKAEAAAREGLQTTVASEIGLLSHQLDQLAEDRVKDAAKAQELKKELLATQAKIEANTRRAQELEEQRRASKEREQQQRQLSKERINEELQRLKQRNAVEELADIVMPQVEAIAAANSALEMKMVSLFSDVSSLSDQASVIPAMRSEMTQLSDRVSNIEAAARNQSPPPVPPTVSAIQQQIVQDKVEKDLLAQQMLQLVQSELSKAKAALEESNTATIRTLNNRVSRLEAAAQLNNTNLPAPSDIEQRIARLESASLSQSAAPPDTTTAALGGALLQTQYAKQLELRNWVNTHEDSAAGFFEPAQLETLKKLPPYNFPYEKKFKVKEGQKEVVKELNFKTLFDRLHSALSEFEADKPTFIESLRTKKINGKDFNFTTGQLETINECIDSVSSGAALPQKLLRRLLHLHILTGTEVGDFKAALATRFLERAAVETHDVSADN